MVLVHIKNGMAAIPYSEVGYRDFHLNAVQMMNEEMLGIMEFVLEKQRLRKLF